MTRTQPDKRELLSNDHSFQFFYSDYAIDALTGQPGSDSLSEISRREQQCQNGMLCTILLHDVVGNSCTTVGSKAHVVLLLGQLMAIFVCAHVDIEI